MKTMKFNPADISIILIAVVITLLSVNINYENIISYPALVESLHILVMAGLLFFFLNARYKKRLREESGKSELVQKNKYFYKNPQPMCIYEIDSLKFVDVNRAALQKYGYTREEILGMTLRDIRSRPEQQKLEWYMGQKLEKYETGDVWKHLTKDGRELIVQLSAHAINYEGKSCRMVSISDITSTVKTTEEIDEYKSFLSEILERVDEGIWVVDTNLNLITSNENFKKHAEALFNLKIEKGESVLPSSLPPRLNQYLRKQYLKALNGENIEFDYNNHSENGESYIQFKILPAKDGQGKIKYLVCVASNVTSYVKVSNQYKEALDQMKLISKSTNDVIWDLDLIENKGKWGNGLKTRFGYDFEETSYQWWLDQIHPEDRERVKANIEDVINSGTEKWRDTYRFKTASGDYKHVVDQGYIMRDKNGEVYRMIGAIQDIHEQVTSEKEINKLSIVASKTSNAVIITDNKENIEWVNDGFTKMTGYTLDEVKGKIPEKVLQGEKSDKNVGKKIRRALSKGEDISVEMINYDKSGREFWMEMTLSPVYDNSENEIEKFVAIASDITSRKERELHLQKTNKILEGIAYITAHGLRRPLANILGLSKLLNSKQKSKERKEEIYKLISKSATELDEQVKEIVNNAYIAQQKR